MGSGQYFHAFCQGLFAIFVLLMMFFISFVIYLSFANDMGDLQKSIDQAIGTVGGGLLFLSLSSCSLAAFLLLRIRSLISFFRFLGGLVAAIFLAIVYLPADQINISAMIENLASLPLLEIFSLFF